MTKEQHFRLEKYESIFRTAIDSKYYRAMDSRFASDFINVCKELNIYINPNCPQCVLKALQTLGKLYFEYRSPEQPASADPADKADKPILEPSNDNNSKTTKTEKKASQNVNKNKKKAK